MNGSFHEIKEIAIVLIVFGSIFGSITAIIVVPLWLRSRERARMQDTVRTAIQQGQTLPSDVIDAMTHGMTRGMKPMPSRQRDFRRAVILLAIAGAIGSWGLLDQLNDGWMHSSDWYGLAAVPLFIGLAFLVLGFLNGKRD